MRSRKPVPETRPAPMFGTLVASRPPGVEREAIGSTLGSIIVHAGLIAVLVYATAEASAAPAPDTPDRMIMLPPPPVTVTPPPPMDAPRPPAAAPVASGFPTIPMPDIVPPRIPEPQAGITIRPEDFTARGVPGAPGNPDAGDSLASGGDDLANAPFITPMEVVPKLRNVAEVERTVSRSYPPILRDAGISGTTVMWFYIDVTGRAVKHQVFKSSGHAALDEAAGKVADVMRFHPAQIQGRDIAVWVQVPVVFRIQ